MGVVGEVPLETATQLHHAHVACHKQLLRECHIIGSEDEVDQTVHNLDRERITSVCTHGCGQTIKN